MDLIRIYSEIAFCKVAGRFLTSTPKSSVNVLGNIMLPKDYFLDEARIHHPELSDDNLVMIYNLGQDDWGYFGTDNIGNDGPNIFQVLACMASQLCEDTVNAPLVHFKDLFRWREITQLIGEDLVTCALLAFNDKDQTETHRRFDWPSVLHNDNPHLNYIYSQKGLCELHSHLKASTSTFEITWVCLMNHIAKKGNIFKKLAELHEPSRTQELSTSLYQIITRAVELRWRIYQYLKSSDKNAEDLLIKSITKEEEIDSKTNMEHEMYYEKYNLKWVADYIMVYPDSPMSIYAGERFLLYKSLQRIFAVNDDNLTGALYQYILAKNLLRTYFIQLNRNIGFSNFKRYQDIKTMFLEKEYNNLVSSLPLWEASEHNFTRIFETRITPVKSKKDLFKQIKKITKFTDPDTLPPDSDQSSVYKPELALIFHFLKYMDKKSHPEQRNEEVRSETQKGCEILQSVKSELKVAGIDAASSELACRPEAFAQGFRFLRHYGFDATFHAGEDFYDIADGLRTIEETITFLDLHACDRIGHAIALGIDAKKYYESRHYTVAMPKQYMLDNVVWLLMKSREYGITADPRTEWFLNDTYQKLINEIGYSKTNDGDRGLIDIRDYWDSMYLRGDNPESYNEDKHKVWTERLSPDTWDYYARLDCERINDIRKYNRAAICLYRNYHSDPTVRERGGKVKSFLLTHGYVQLITGLQKMMMRKISKNQLCIECCPSSNIRIGRLDRFDTHPIFRFMPVKNSDSRYTLAVTVNTDDLGVFATSLPNEYSLLALALLKKKDAEGNNIYSSQEVYDWIERVIDNSHKFTFLKHNLKQFDNNSL